MYWKIAFLPETSPVLEQNQAPAGRFVLHRHVDAAGPHRDLRLEQAGYLVGWRFEQAPCADGVYAIEKAPHPLRWLEHDGDAVREEAGLFTVITWSKDLRELLLEGRHSTQVLRAERMPFLSPETARALHESIREMALEPAALAGILRDGVTARQRALERFCGLGRELDGAAFDEAIWRRTLESLSLEEITRHLRAYEVRFDHKFPPLPTSQPEALADSERGAWTNRAMGIVRDG